MENELTHWGILGMKWGMRRYQYPDGTLTPAGKVRYQKKLQKESKYEKELMIKNRGTLTDQELKDAIARSQLEKQLKDVTENNLYPAKAVIKDETKKKLIAIGITAGTGLGLYTLNRKINGKPFIPADIADSILSGKASTSNADTAERKAAEEVAKAAEEAKKWQEDYIKRQHNFEDFIRRTEYAKQAKANININT